jgi:complement component 1 Q subcomponent-binding protein
LYCQFETLDLNFQEEFEKFLQERGVNESLAFFVPEYAQLKEQKVDTFMSPVFLTRNG